jgi:hypothetical protein
MRDGLPSSDDARNLDATTDASGLDRRVNRLAAERATLFSRAAAHPGLSQTQRQRVKDIERELDECFVLRRQQRAARDARRFSRYDFHVNR